MQPVEMPYEIRDFASLLAYLADKLEWRLDLESFTDLDDLTFDWSADSLRINDAQSRRLSGGLVRQLRSLVHGQPWGIFLVEFTDERIYRTALREILRGLVFSRRRDSQLPSWQHENLLFICATRDYERITFAHFRGEKMQKARLATFGWQRDSSYLRTLLEFNLPNLHWPEDPSDSAAWLKQWASAFDVEKVTKQFFREIANWYFWALKHVRFPKDAPKEADGHDHVSVIRLITRLIFCWFVKEKGLIPDALFDERELTRTLKDFAPGKNSAKDSVFYRAILQNLFFATLNTEMDKRGWTREEQNFMAHSLYRHKECFRKPGEALELFKSIPFLNGGLFECLDKDLGETARPRYVRVDGFSRRADSQPIVPDFLFFGAERDVDLRADYGAPKYKRVTVRGLIHTLNHYNFTIEENTPLDQEVALDPELSGKVFENLLAAYNPETGATARKQTGSFYTPREIVSYMVDEALLAYLKTKLEQGGTDILVCDSKGDKGGTGIPACVSSCVSSSESDTGISACVSEPTDKNVCATLEEPTDKNVCATLEEPTDRNVCATMKSATLEDRLRHLFAYNDEPHPFTAPEVDAVIAAIDNLKALDPAVGSGAFPMGILHRLVFILGKLDPRNEKWKERQVRRVRDAIATAEKIEEAALRERAVRELEHQIAGVNEAFERNELDYGRKLYLIENCIYGVDIQPIAVQIAKMRFFISLIVDQRVEGDTGIPACAPSTERDTSIPACDLKTAQTGMSVPPLPPWNRGVRPLPNLETKFVAANTLIGIERPEAQGKLFSNAKVDKLKSDLTGIRHRMFTARTPSTKQHLRERDETIRLALAEEIRESFGKANDDEIHRIQIEIEKTRKALEEEQSKPVEWEITRFTNLFGETEETRRDKAKEKKRHLREQIKALEANLLRATHRDTEIDATAKQLADWDPYDQNASADFFDPEWMFGLNKGFDITIGNPPYVRADEQSDWNRRQREQILAGKSYETLWEKWDLFVPFIEKGYKLLKPGGVTTLIVSDAFCHSKYAQKPQNWFLQHARILRLDFCSNLQIFDAAVHNLIYFFQKADGARNVPDRRAHCETFGNVTLLPSDEQTKLTYRAFFPEDGKREAFFCMSLPLDVTCYVSIGMVVNAHEELAPGEFTMEDLVQDHRDAKHPKRFAEGKHLDTWLPATHRWLEWGTQRAPALFRRPTFPEMYEANEKILVQRSPGPDPKCCYDDQHLHFTESTVAFIPWNILSGVRNNSLKKAARYWDELPPRPDLPNREDLEATSRRFAVKYLLGVMNSTAARDFLRANRRSNIHLYPDDWKKLPIPDVPPEQQKPIVALVERILAAKRTDPATDTSVLEREIDHLVYGLYGLTADEIKIVEEGSK